MNYLAINTASFMEVLVSFNSQTEYVHVLDKSLASTQLLPTINNLLTKLNATLNQMDFFACVIGAGSFTGLRIGITTINALGYALNKPLIPLTFFDYLAVNKPFPLTTAISSTSNVSFIQNFHSLTHKDPPICIQNDDVISLAHKKIIANVPILPSPNIEVFCPNKNDFNTAVQNAFKQNPPQKQLTPLYLRRSQAQRKSGEL